MRQALITTLSVEGYSLHFYSVVLAFFLSYWVYGSLGVLNRVPPQEKHEKKCQKEYENQCEANALMHVPIFLLRTKMLLSVVRYLVLSPIRPPVLPVYSA